ncbi:MFS transporter [Sanguibacter antarcticus]|uniref:Transmembrane secretion effector n=1 Tax=Sanguibacter antarcticus TaxID=372484 RepID=A0A2A9E256_9MICO|nr:MFS transporter [Sanguibacter antarcticus]PFG32661.1 transmembrane secretion effector [Sanguibacter antarcticus]
MPSLFVDTTPLRTAPFRRLWWGLGVSNLGAQLTVVAVGLQVYSLSGSTFAVGLLGVFALVPLVVLGLYGGALVDAYDRRTVALCASTVLWVVTMALAAQAWLGLDSVPVLYGLVALQSAAFAVNNPARSAIIPRLIEPSLLPAANTLMTISWNVALTVGPLSAALIVARWGYAAVYTVDVVCFSAALWALVQLPGMPPEPSTEPAGEGRPGDPENGGRGAVGRRRGAGLGSVVDGLRYLATRPIVRMTFLVDLAAMVFAMPRVLFPAIGVVVLGGGEGTTGALTAALAVGGLLAGVLSGGLTRLHRQGLVIVWAIVCWGLSVAGFGLVLVLAGRTYPGEVLVGGLVAALVMLVLCGASDAVSAVFRQTILQSATPDNMRGRLQGVFIVVVAGGPRLGDVVLGAQATWWGEGWAAVVGGLLCVVVLLALVRWQPRLLAYDARRPEA